MSICTQRRGAMERTEAEREVKALGHDECCMPVRTMERMRGQLDTERALG
jgi:hypothetical protein